jgi:hypothetical protein
MKKRAYLGTSLALVLCIVSCGELESPTNPAMVPFSNSVADGGSVALADGEVTDADAAPVCANKICSDVTCWTEGCSPNHCDPGADNRYDIWQDNCHSAANSCVMKHPKTAGIVSCGGKPQCLDNPGNHTFNYIINPNGTVTYWNWGIPCGPCSGPPPPANKIDPTDCHGACIKKGCGKYFNGDEEVLPLGETVEIPGPSTCVTKVFDEHGFDPKWGGECYACCDRRADVWRNDIPKYKQRQCDREDFRHACKELCQGFYELPACPFSLAVQACKSDGSGPREPWRIKHDCKKSVKAHGLSDLINAQCLHVCMENTITQAKRCSCPPQPTTTDAGAKKDAGAAEAG